MVTDPREDCCCFNHGTNLAAGRRVSPRSAGHVFPVLIYSLAVLFGSPASVAAAERLCDSAFEDCRAPLLQLIANEKVGIDVAFWFMEDSRYATALVNKHKAGVPVRVIVDSKANVAYPGNKTQLATLKNGGVPMRERTSLYLHWKLMLFHGQNTVEFSGANYSPNAFVPNDPYVDYVDEVIYFTDDPSVVNSFKTRFDDAWVSTSGYRNYANISTALTRSHATYPIDPELNFPPSQNFATRSVGRYNAETVGIDSIIYRIDDDRHTNAVIAAINRGVPVRILSEPKQYRDPARLWHSYNIDRLYMAGAQIRHRAHLGLNHEKLTLLRGQRMTVFGSSNWTRSSSDQQNEHNYFTTKPWFYAWSVAHFDRKWHNLATNPATGQAYQESKPFVPLPPDTPSYRTPTNGAQGIADRVTLRWHGGPWAHLYDVYFGSDPSNLALVATNLSLGPSTSSTTTQGHTITGLASSTTYYWQVVSKTVAQVAKRGPIWSFRTSGALPAAGDGDVVLYAGRATTLAGNWQVTADATAAGGARVANPNAGAARPSTALAAPADYFEMTFMAAAGVPYRLWVRGQAQSNSYNNDSVYVQFSGSVTATGAATFRIGTTSGTTVQIEQGSNAGLAGWGWADNAYGGDALPIYFATSGTHTVRVQRREDGISIDQLILSIDRFAVTAPGFPKNDATIYAPAGGSADGGDTGAEEGEPPPPPPTLPDGWTARDIGAVGVTGAATQSGGVFTVKGAGADIWGTSDAFHYVYRPLAGDGALVARVAALSGADAWTKGGVMVRQSLHPSSPHGLMLVSKSKGTAFQRRTAAGGVSTHTAGPAGTAPRFVKISRAGTTITASISTDGFAWTVVGTDTIALDGPVLIGLAVTSHSTASTATLTFDNVALTAR